LLYKKLIRSYTFLHSNRYTFRLIFKGDRSFQNRLAW